MNLNMVKREKRDYLHLVYHFTVPLILCNIVNNDYHQDSKVIYTFVPNKLFGQLLDISPKFLYFQKLLIQNIHILMSGLLIKILNH